MKRARFGALAAMLIVGLLAGCVPMTVPSQVIEREVEVTRIVEKPVEVTRVVEQVVEQVAQAPATTQTWQLVNPEGVVVVEPVEVNPHPATLEDTTIALYWNGKHNGDNFLDRIAELLEEEVPGVTLIKVWEEHPDTVGISGSVEKSKAKAVTMAEYNPDIVIASQAD